jgi:hypothetical protein
MGRVRVKKDVINNVCHSGLSGICLQQYGIKRNDSGQAGMTNRAMQVLTLPPFLNWSATAFTPFYRLLVAISP